MRVLFCADVVGRPGRDMLKKHIANIKKEYAVDVVIVNYENASHGFGLSAKNAKELLKLPIDVMTGGNHTWDKKDIIPLLEELPLLRPINYPKATPGRGLEVLQVGEDKLAIINLMGNFTMPMVDNPFVKIVEVVERLEEAGVEHIFIDMHAEATSEKRALLGMLRGRVSAICGSHTHVGTDDLSIDEGTCYVTDVGMTGCRDNSLGMAFDEVIERFTTGVSGRFEVPNHCKKMLQGVIFELDSAGECSKAFKVKAYDDAPAEVVQHAYHEQ